MAGSEHSSPEIFATRLADPNICTCIFFPCFLHYIILNVTNNTFYFVSLLLKQLEQN
jgi:hypothetical protein